MEFLAFIPSPWIYFIVFFGKIIEVAVSTVRVLLINRGERLAGTLLSVVEVTFWVVIASNVLNDLSSDPLKAIVYIVAFAVGIYLGSWLEEKLAFGLCSINIVAPCTEEAHSIADKLRLSGFAVTLLQAEGIGENKKPVLMLLLKRKDVSEASSVAQAACPGALLTVSSVSSVKGGFIRNSGVRKLFK